MTIQAILNQNVTELLPLVKTAVLDAPDEFCSNQMKFATLRACIDVGVPISEMNDDELNSFQADLISTFKEKRWLAILPV